MNEFIEKLIGRLEEYEQGRLEMHDWQGQTAIVEAIEIVKQEAEQYNNTIIDGKYCFQTCACTEKCDKCSRLCNGDIDWYENIDDWTEEYNNGWIPVKTRPMTKEECEYIEDCVYGESFMYECKLPDDNQEVLIYTKYGTIRQTTFYTDMGCYFENYEDDDEVTAWQPLPQPYQPKGE